MATCCPGASSKEMNALHSLSKGVNKALHGHGVTPRAATYVKMACDPFHDVELLKEGFPDATGGQSVVYAVKKEIEIIKPSTYSTGDSFDSHFAWMPNVSGCYCEGRSKQRFPVLLGTQQFNEPTLPQGEPPVGESYNSVICALAGSEPTHSPRTPCWKDYDTETNVMPGGSIVVCTNKHGQNTFDPLVKAHYTSIGIDEFFNETGAPRLIGAAFEVHNVTEKVHVSGRVTTYKFENSPGPTQTLMHTNLASETIYDAARGSQTTPYSNYVATSAITGHESDVNFQSNQGQCSFRKRRAPPVNIAQATQIGEAPWEAERGCLIPGTFDVADDMIPYRPTNIASLSMGETFDSFASCKANLQERGANGDDINTFFKFADPPYASTSSGHDTGIDTGRRFTTGWSTAVRNTQWHSGDHSTWHKGENLSYAEPTHETSLGSGGAYFTGLHSETKLILTATFFVELYPYPSSTLYPLSSPSCPFDPKALEILARIFHDMPAGVPVDFNGMGDFLRMVVDKIRTFSSAAAPYITPALSALSKMPIPYAQQIATGGLIAQAGAQMLPRNRAEVRSAVAAATRPLANRVRREQLAANDAERAVARNTRAIANVQRVAGNRKRRGSQ